MHAHPRRPTAPARAERALPPGLFALLLCTLVASLACFGTNQPTPQAQEAPIEEEQRAQLVAFLHGNWRFVEIRQSPDAEQARGGAVRLWGLREDGTLLYGEPGRARRVYTGEWWLEGRNLYMRLSMSGNTSIYRVERWGPGQMTWYNYRDKTYIIVERADLIDV